jgi:hypothetical protein
MLTRSESKMHRRVVGRFAPAVTAKSTKGKRRRTLKTQAFVLLVSFLLAFPAYRRTDPPSSPSVLPRNQRLNSLDYRTSRFVSELTRCLNVDTKAPQDSIRKSNTFSNIRFGRATAICFMTEVADETGKRKPGIIEGKRDDSSVAATHVVAVCAKQ